MIKPGDCYKIPESGLEFHFKANHELLQRPGHRLCVISVNTETNRVELAYELYTCDEEPFGIFDGGNDTLTLGIADLALLKGYKPQDDILKRRKFYAHEILTTGYTTITRGASTEIDWGGNHEDVRSFDVHYCLS